MSQKRQNIQTTVGTYLLNYDFLARIDDCLNMNIGVAPLHFKKGSTDYYDSFLFIILGKDCSCLYQANKCLRKSKVAVIGSDQYNYFIF